MTAALRKARGAGAMLLPTLPALAVIVLWSVASHLSSNVLVPRPQAVASKLLDLLLERTFWRSAGVTAVSLLRAFVIAAAIGLSVGALLSRSSFWAHVMEPLLAGLFAVPLVLLFPLFVLWFGVGPASKVGYAATYACVPIALGTLAACRAGDARLVRAGRAMGASPLQRLRHILLPVALPGVFNALRIGLFIALASVLGGEAVLSSSGLGHRLASAAELANTAEVVALIIAIAVFALALNGAAAFATQRLQPGGGRP